MPMGGGNGDCGKVCGHVTLEAGWAGVVVVDGVSEILPRKGDHFVDGFLKCQLRGGRIAHRG